MGKEAQVRATFADGEDEGRLQLEPPRLIFRGTTRRVFEGALLSGAQGECGDLVLPGGERFAFGEKAAASWAEAINNPRSRLDKLGVKPGLRVGVIGVEDPTFEAELAERDAPALADRRDLDLVFYAADSAGELARIGDLLPALAERGAMWVVSRKGKAATVKDVEVMAAARAAGLVDSKVCAFSDTLTALRFTRRR